jgi:hypothetical protein
MALIVWVVLGAGWVVASLAFAVSSGFIMRSTPKPSPRRKRGVQLAA